MDLIEAKASGKTEIIAPPAALAEDKVVDLMAALEASVKEAKQARKRHPAATSGEADAAPAKKRTRQSASRADVAEDRSEQVVAVAGRLLTGANPGQALHP